MSDLMSRILEIQKNPNLSDAEKAAQRQLLMSGKWLAQAAEETEEKEEADEEDSKLKDMLQCTICHELCVRPVTAPCQHNFCLKCFQSLVNRSGKSCPTCRQEFGAKFAANPRINTALTVAIRSFKAGASSAAAKACERINDSDRPDEAFTTDRAVRAGRANAASGRIMVTVPNDHFGPIPPEADPRGQGIRVGEWWKDRLDCRQWGAHFPHVAGIAGQSNVGAQSVVLSGGYEDDMDEGEWFLYTGSGGRDLSGNKRTNKFQSHDQKFDSMNQALRLSCERGLPVRVVRSFKEKRSSYAPSPDTPVRYDGVYRIVACWRKPGAQGFLMCRYLFVRADSEPAPWSSEDAGDGDLPDAERLPPAARSELSAADRGAVFRCKGPALWVFDAAAGRWGWGPGGQPASLQGSRGAEAAEKAGRKRASEQERALRQFGCGLCKQLVRAPLSTPCGHAFCKPCLDARFAGLADEVAGGGKAAGVRAMRARKVPKPCPTCAQDLAEFLKTARVNKDMEAVVAKLQASVKEAKEKGGEGERADDGRSPEASDDLDASSSGNSAASSEGGGEPAAAAASLLPPLAQAGRSLEGETLSAEFPEFDADLVGAMLADEGDDLAAVRFALTRMRNQMAVEEKKKKRQARLDEASLAPEAGSVSLPAKKQRVVV